MKEERDAHKEWLAKPTAEVDLDSYQDNSHKFGEGGLMDG